MTSDSKAMAAFGNHATAIVYPNYRNGIPYRLTQFFHYDPDVKDWYVYGVGRVTPNAAQVVPDTATRFYSFTGAMLSTGDSPAA